MNTELEQIPVLGDDNTELQIISYLRWLWRSPFRYHLDDDLKDIVWSGLDKHPSDEILDRLATNLERAYQFAGLHTPMTRIGCGIATPSPLTLRPSASETNRTA